MSQIVHTRLSKKTTKTLDQLAIAKGTNRATEIRKAVETYLSEYTGDPDINNIQKRLITLENKLNILEAEVFGKAKKTRIAETPSC